MKTITFTCETIPPMFLAGADGQTPELRPPSIKGALRFWWRAMNAGNFDSIDELKCAESAIFGGSDENSSRSKLIIKLKSIQPEKKEIIEGYPTPHKDKPFKKNAIQKGFIFIIELGVIPNLNLTIDKVKNLFILFAVLGGLGNRSRRGFGSFKINSIDEEGFKMPVIKEDIVNLIIASSYKMVNSKHAYPYLKEIHVGSNPYADITKVIGEKTHSFNQKYLQDYGNAMGKARGGRFASPIYVSVIENDKKLYPIFSILNTALPNNGNFNNNIQQEFIKSLL